MAQIAKDIRMHKSVDDPNSKYIKPGRDGISSISLVRPGGLVGLLQGTRQFLQDLIDYRFAKTQLCAECEEFHSLFRRFLTATVGHRCLHLMFDRNAEPELGPNWVTVDLQKVERRSQETGVTSIGLDNEYFDAVLCTGLDRISQPERLIRELKRVLATNGQIWVQVPLCAPYFAVDEASKTQYWRITPDGLRVLFRDFDEILCSVFLPAGNALRSFSFYYGLKGSDD